MNPQFSFRIYRLLLNAYPAEFRDEYGALMAQLFSDRYRDEAKRKQKLALWSFWFAILYDLMVTASKEHSQKLRRSNRIMNNLKNDLFGLLLVVVIIVAAFMLLSYGRSHEVASILLFGYVLDALITTGVVGNLIVFLLVKLTRWNPIRVALWTFLIVHGVPVILLALVGGRIDPQFRLGAVLIGYAVSFLFWFGLHWAWRSTNRSALANS